MALSACGLHGAARQVTRGCGTRNRPTESWPRSSLGGQVTAPAAESHHAAYVAVGAWHECPVTGDESHALTMWPTVRRAVEWNSRCAASRGEIAWERDANGTAGAYALLSGCSSIHQSLRCAVALGKLADDPRPDWELAADRLADLVGTHPEAFADKSRFAMDWYYPVLGGAVRGAAAVARLKAGWDTFVVPGLGVRCVSDQPWVTGAETCELVLALDACGLRAQAAAMFATTAHLRHQDGSYWTGWQYANRAHFPAERSSWTAAAVVLAADALMGWSRRSEGYSGVCRSEQGERRWCRASGWCRGERVVQARWGWCRLGGVVRARWGAGGALEDAEGAPRRGLR